MSRPTVVITTRPPTSPDFEGLRDLQLVAAKPYSLNGLVIGADVDNSQVARSVLQALLRGASAVLRLQLPAEERATFLDQLHRIADVSDQHTPRIDALQKALLELLYSGLSLREAADRIGVSRRTADRQLAAARTALGAATTVEAVMMLRRSD